MNIIHNFNMNDSFIVISLFIGTIIVLILPKRFTKKTTCNYLLCGVFFGFLFDHTLAVIPVSYYAINDSTSFELMDFFSHVMYAPFSYLFFYLYDLFNIRTRFSLLYVLVWVFVSIGIELFCVSIGIFHYKNGYNSYYSFVIYFLVQSTWIIFYRIITVYGDKTY